MWLKERRRDEKIKAFSSIVIGITNLFMNHYLMVTSFSFLFCSLIGYLNEYFLLQHFDINIVSFAEINDFFLASLKTPEYLIYFPLLILIIFYLFQIARKLLKINDDVNKAKGIIEESRSNIKKAKESIQTVEKYLNKINHIRFDLSMFFHKHNINKLTQQMHEQMHQAIKIRDLSQSIHDESIKDNENRLNNAVDLRKRSLLKAIFCMVILIIIIYLHIESTLNNRINRIIKNPKVMNIIELNNNKILPSEPCQPLVFITATNKFMFFYQHGTEKVISSIAIPITSIRTIQSKEFNFSIN